VALILENARVHTLDPRRPHATAVGVDGGRVRAIGRRGEVRRALGPRAERIDCGGAALLPGLVDPHLHLLALAARDAHLDVGGCATRDAVLDAIARRARTLPRGAWVRAEGLDDAVVGRLPTATELAAVAGGRPVRLRHRSRHASVLCTRALARLPRSVPRDAAGLVVGHETVLSRVVGPLPDAVLAAGLDAAMRGLVAAGITTVADATPRTHAGLRPLRAAARAGRLAVRVHAMRAGPASWPSQARLVPGAVKLLVEEDAAGLRPDPATLARRIARAAASGAQVAVHCTSAAMLVAALDGFAALPARLRRGRRHRIEHCGECPPPLVPALAALDLVVVTNPAFVALRGDAYRTEHPETTWPWLYRARSLLRAGVPLAGASDAPVSPPDPWRAMAAARTRRTPSGAVLGGVERLPAAAALDLFTRGAAFALRDDARGRLVVGGPADLVVVEPDPLRASPDEVATARVRLTLVDGEVAWAA
jgi:predicted amidohydrolase YtcJ